jgi:transcriptional regulator with XRE-family HTH domain
MLPGRSHGRSGRSGDKPLVSGVRCTSSVNEGQIACAAVRSAALARARLAEDIDHLCADAGLSHAALARAAGVPASFLARILAGTAHPSLETYARITTALGADPATRAYPNTGPAIRDRHSVPILEALLGSLHARWKPYTEVAVRRPSRGWIDVVLHDGHASLLLATEIQSTLRRIEQLVR